jgi:phosphate transport system substrate-binding protein
VTSIRSRLRRWLAVGAALALAVAVLVQASPQQAQAASYIPITGTGSTWSQNAIDQWRKNVAANYGMTVNYTGTGSSAGRQNFIDGSVDFAISEIPFQTNPTDGSPPENPRSGFAYMPIVAGGTSFMYNLKIGGKRVTNLRLSGDTVTKIFTGKITNWNDPQIAGDNPGLAMPDKAITPVVRSDGSGSTAQFTLWMAKQHPDLWNSFCSSNGGCTAGSLTSQYPLFGNVKGQNGSLGVAGYVSQSYGEGAITYVEYSYALKSGFPVAKVLNRSGYYVEPTASSVAVGLLGASINTDLTQILDNVYNNGDPRTYPLSSYSYMIIPTQVSGIFTADKGNTLGAFANYFLCEGQQQAEALGYSPLPMNLVLAGFDQIKRIPGANVAGVDINQCNNPTFKPGDSPSNNQLALTAPQPAACDKQGPDQCTTGTAGAPDETPVSGSGNGGSASGAGASAAAAGGAAGAAGTSGALYDENGQLLTAAAGGGTAVSTPFTLASSEWGAPQGLMLLAAALLVLAIFLPPFLSRRLRGSRAKSR